MFAGRRQNAELLNKVTELEGRMAAIGRSQAVIEFNLDGTIISANENFLLTMGYGLDEIRGAHHRTFMEADEAASAEYAALNEGKFVARKFRRLAKGGREVWLQASYNPIFDPDGRAVRVIKLAVDITREEQEAMRAEAARLEAEKGQTALVDMLAESLTQLSAGDLTTRVDGQMSGVAHRRICEDYNSAVETLRKTLTQVVEAVRALHGGSDEISTASDDLSRRTEQQAASLEETAAALDEITATVRRSAEGARQASSAAAGARAEAQRSGEVVRNAMAAMDAIQKSSVQIGDIIGVIDEIAFQTNLLALNAGVEAARAGDSGRGFAVVASEVRSLAQRSAEAAKEIKTLISTSTGQVNAGVKLVDEAGAALSAIGLRVAEMDALVSEIAASALEQSTGLHQVNTAVNQMDQVTQQNAAMVEETTAAAANLKAEAGQLAALAAQFQTGAEAEAYAPVVQTLRPRAGMSASLARERSRIVAVAGGGAPRGGGWEEF